MHSNTDMRYFGDIVARIRDPWCDPTTTVPARAGSGSLRRAAFRQDDGIEQVASDLRDMSFRVVRWTARDGVLKKVDSLGAIQRMVRNAKVAATALQVAGAAEPSVGVGGNVVAFLAEVATRWQLNAEFSLKEQSVDPYVSVAQFEQALRQAANVKPLVIVVDDADKVDRPDVWWDVLFGTLLPRSADRLPMLLVLGVERTSSAASYALQVIDRRLIPGGLAEEIRLPRLDPARIAAVVGPLDDGLFEQIRSLINGRPAWLDEIWREWRKEGAVVLHDGRWVAAPDTRDRVGHSIHGWVVRALHAGGPGGEAFEQALTIVQTAALEGQRFTAEALAAVLRIDVEQLIGWINEHLVDRHGQSLLKRDGIVKRRAGLDPRALRCYRFRSAVIAGVLRDDMLTDKDGKALAGRYARALALVYQASSVSNIAWTINRLATTAGDEELAEYIWRRANRLED